MLTETASDPRRANWLTITSMTEDLCWPEETSTTRPTWELEAEILRLTTRLMMRERDLKQAKSQLKTQTAKSQQQVVSWRRRMEEKEEQMKELLVQKDAEMQSIVSQLMIFEAELMKEQARIEDLLSEKDAQILLQQKEIERLKRSQSVEDRESASTPSAQCGVTTLDINSSDFITGERLKHVMDFKPSTIPIIVSDYGQMEFSKRSTEIRPDSDVKDCISAQNLNNSSWLDSESHSNTGDTSVLESSSRSDDEKSKSNIGKQNGSDELAFHCPTSFKTSSDVKNNSYSTNSAHPNLTHTFNSYLPSSYSRLDGANNWPRCPQSISIFEDRFQYDSQYAVQKLKDGLVKMRAIQDVTNVKNLEPSHDAVMTERKRIPFKSPQKMKDLKAKRINTHKIHRPVIAEMTAQAIL